MMKILKVLLTCLSLLWHTTSFAKKNQNKYNLKEIALPSEVKDLPKNYGSVFFSPAVKDSVLVPVHFWGEIKKSGLHFLPINTSFMNGLSIAGGPQSSAELDNIKVTRKANDGTLKVLEFDLSSGGNDLAYKEVLQPGDSVFVPRSNFYENRSYYTSLIGVLATILSSVLVINQINNN